MKLRRARVDDVDRLDLIERENFAPPKYTPLSRRQLLHHCRSNRSYFVVATVDGRVDGYGLGLMHRQRRSLRFYSLAVARESQGGEIGRRLFEEMERFAGEAGLDMQCEIREDNDRLLNRYRGLGYEVYRRIENYYPDGEACLKMLKPHARSPE